MTSDQPTTDSRPAVPEMAHRRESASGKKHRRDTWLFIVTPMVGGGALMVILLVLALLLPQPGQVSLVSDLMLSTLVLCPLAICLFPIYVVLVIAAVGMNKIHGSTEKPLKRVESLSRSLAERTIQTTDSINRKSISVASKFALLDRLWGIFDTIHEDEHGDSTTK